MDMSKNISKTGISLKIPKKKLQDAYDYATSDVLEILVSVNSKEHQHVHPPHQCMRSSRSRVKEIRGP